MIAEGSTVPDFTLESDSGRTVSSAALRGSWFVLYFYPKADTPGCTREAQAFTAQRSAFADLDVKVFGVSKDKIAALCKFRDKYALAIDLLADPELGVHKAFGAFGEKVMYGKKVEGVIRSTFVVDPDGRVARVFPKVKVDGHAEKVLDIVRKLQSGGAETTPLPKPSRAPKTGS